MYLLADFKHRVIISLIVILGIGAFFLPYIAVGLLLDQLIPGWYEDENLNNFQFILTHLLLFLAFFPGFFLAWKSCEFTYHKYVNNNLHPKEASFKKEVLR